jgi:VWFA-related protein
MIRSLKRCLLFVALAGAIPAVGQSPLPGEVRVSSRPYAPASPYTLRVETDLVEVGAVVRDDHGRSIAGLTARDFQVFDQGKERPIESLSVETLAASGGTGAALRSGSADTVDALPQPAPTAVRAPRFIALYFDDLGTNAGDLMHARLAAQRFVEEGLAPGDRVAIFTSSATHTLDFTSRKPALLAAIEKVQSHPRFLENGMAGCPHMTPFTAYLIANDLSPMALQAVVDEVYGCAGTYNPDLLNRSSPNPIVVPPQLDMVRQMVKGMAERTWQEARIISQDTLDSIDAVVSVLARMPGSRMLLLVSSGFLAGTLEREQGLVIDRALHAGVVINALDAKGLYAEAPVRPLDQPLDGEMELPPSTFQFEISSSLDRLDALAAPMANFAQSTGGLFFHNNNDLAFGFRELAAIPQVTYVLTFRPDSAASTGRYHKLRVQLAFKNSYSIEARPGYFALPRDTAAPADWRSRLDRQIKVEEPVQEFPVTLTVQSRKLAGGSVVFTARIHVDLKTMRFPQRDGRRTQKLTFVTALVDAHGTLVAAKEGAMDLALTDASYARFSAIGVNAVGSLEAPPGGYRLRAVVQDGVDGRTSSVAQAVDVR